MHFDTPPADRPHHLAHTMIRVGDLERSLAFYRDALGLQELRREEFPEAKFTLVFLGFGDERTHTVIELTHNHGVSRYDHGTAFGHIAFTVADIHAAAARLEQMGVRVLRPPGPMAHAATNGRRDVIAFIEDPDGYRIELIETPHRPVP